MHYLSFFELEFSKTIVIFEISTLEFVHFFSVWVFFHEHSQIIGLQEKGRHFTSTYILAVRLLWRAHLCT